MRRGAATLWDLALWAAGRRKMFRVTGHSMAPTLNDGDRVFVRRGVSLPSPGDVVVARHPTEPTTLLIKRVRSVTDTTFAVGSDDPTAGTDSRHFGSLSQEHLVGSVVATWSTGSG